MKPPNTKSWVIVPDLHVPYHCPAYINLISKIIKKVKPDGIVQLGDAVDWFQLSTYDKDPRRLNTVLEDLMEYKSILYHWASLLRPGSMVYQLAGNHEKRLTRYIWQHAGKLLELVKSVPEVLSFSESNKAGPIKFKWFDIEEWDACRIGDVVLHHGHFFNMHVAVGNLNRYPTKIITGHTHRVQYATNGERWSLSLGHGSNERVTSHIPAPTNWEQAFAILTVVNGIGHVEPVIVKNGSCVFRGEYIKA